METSPVLTPAAISAVVGDAWRSHLERNQRAGSPHRNVWASGWRVCDRRLVLDMTAADKLPPWSADTLAKFRRGDDRERDLLMDLQRIGREGAPPFQIVGQQERFELKDRKGRIVITGKVDAQLGIADTRAPLEVKAWAPTLVERIETFSDLFENPWTRSGGYQLLSYLYGAARPFGFMLLDRAGLPLLLPVELDAHLDRMEEFLTRAERAVDHVEAETLPDFLVGDAAECQRCPWYGTECQPPISGKGATILTDPELEAELARHDELKAAGKEFERLDKRLKDKLRGVELGVAGAFSITGKWSKSSRVEMPDAVKKLYTVTDPKGRFTLEFTRLAPPAPPTTAS